MTEPTQWMVRADDSLTAWVHAETMELMTDGTLMFCDGDETRAVFKEWRWAIRNVPQGSVLPGRDDHPSKGVP